MYHSFYYPDDVDARVPYVAPLNFGVEDERIYAFLDQVGSSGERRKVRKFQKLALKNQDKYLDAFKKLSEENFIDHLGVQIGDNGMIFDIYLKGYQHSSVNAHVCCNKNGIYNGVG